MKNETICICIIASQNRNPILQSNGFYESEINILKSKDIDPDNCKIIEIIDIFCERGKPYTGIHDFVDGYELLIELIN